MAGRGARPWLGPAQPAMAGPAANAGPVTGSGGRPDGGWGRPGRGMTMALCRGHATGESGWLFSTRRAVLYSTCRFLLWSLRVVSAFCPSFCPLLLSLRVVLFSAYCSPPGRAAARARRGTGVLRISKTPCGAREPGLYGPRRRSRTIDPLVRHYSRTQSLDQGVRRGQLDGPSRHGHEQPCVTGCVP